MNESRSEFVDTYGEQNLKSSKLRQVLEKQQNNSLTQKQQSPYRYLVLFFSIWIIIPAFYCFDQPIAIYKTLQEMFQEDQTFNFDIYFASLYIIYAFGNSFLPLFTGGMRDTHGDKMVMAYIGGIMMLGQLVFTLGVFLKSFILMVCGRVLLGWGVESLLPLWTSFLSQYFRNSISIILSILQFFAQVGLVLSIYLTSIIQKQFNLMISLLCGIIGIGIGFLLLTIAFIIDERINEETSQRQINSDIILQDESKLFPNKIYFFKFRDFKVFPQMFWLLLAFNSIFYCSIVTLVNVSMYVMASVLFGVDNQIEELDIALFWMLGCFSLLLIGPIVNYFTYRRYLIITAVIIVIIGHIEYLTNQHFGLVIIAIGYCLAFVCTWSAIVHIIKLKSFGKAFGITVAIQNLIFVFMPFLLDIVNRKLFGQFQALLFFTLLSLIIAIQILVEDIRCYNILDNQVARMHLSKIYQNVSNEENINNNESDLFQKYLQQQE